MIINKKYFASLLLICIYNLCFSFVTDSLKQQFSEITTDSFTIYYNMGNEYYDKGDYEQAELHYYKAIDISEATGAADQMSEIYMYLSKMEEVRNNYDKALEYNKICAGINDSAFTADRNKKIAEMQAKYETAKKEKEIEILNKDKLLRQAELKRRSNWLIVFISGFVAVSGLLVIIFFQKKQKTKACRELVYKNLQIIGSGTKKPDKTGSNDESIPSGIIPVSGEQNINKYSTSPLDEQQKQDILERIVDLMEKENIYLDSNISVDMCAEKMDINRNYISQVINEKLDRNFNNFVNGYRIKKAQLMMADNDSEKYTVEDISSLVGFKSRTSFNAAFKRYTGVTPSFYLKTVHNENLTKISGKHQEIL